MVHEDSIKPDKPRTPKPFVLVGAGPLSSTVWKTGDEHSGWRYRFNLFRLPAHNGRVSQLFRPSDLVDLAKLLQVLAAVIADDGCLTQTDRRMLTRLNAELDELLRRYANDDSN